MIVKSEMPLYNFCFWGGAVSHVSDMTHAQISEVEDALDSIYPDGMTETEINDIFWFEPDFLAECNGFSSWDEMIEFNDTDN